MSNPASLSGHYRPPPRSTYLNLPTPSLTPNVSSSSNSSSSTFSYPLSQSHSLSYTSSLTSDVSSNSPFSSPEDVAPLATAMPIGKGDVMLGDSAPIGKALNHQSSRPSLRHMPSWTSFSSYRSKGSLASKASQISLHHPRPTLKRSDGTLSHQLSQDSDDHILDGVFEDALGDDGQAEFGAWLGESDMRGRSREKSTSGISVSSRKSGKGMTQFAGRIKKLSISSITQRSRPPIPSFFIDQDAQLAWQEDSPEEINGALQRAGTPFEHPSNSPRRSSGRSSGQTTVALPTMVEMSPPVSPSQDYFTPPTIPTSLMAAVAQLPVNPNLPTRSTPASRLAFSTSLRQRLTESAIILDPASDIGGISAPLPIPVEKVGSVSATGPTASPSWNDRIADAENDVSSVDFNLDIFSPRAPQQPVLKGVVNTNPISPLELPVSQFSTMDSRPSIMAVLSSSDGAIPISEEEESRGLRESIMSPTLPDIDGMPNAQHNLGHMVNNSYSRRPLAQHSSSNPTSLSRSTGRVPSGGTPPRSGLIPSSISASSVYRLPRASVPSPTTRSPASPFAATSSIVPSLPYSRRHSAIIRPPILPTPTPPSLITTPKSLGNPIVIPTTYSAGQFSGDGGSVSPISLAEVIAKIGKAPPMPLDDNEGIAGSLPSSRIRKTSAVVRFGVLSPTGALGVSGLVVASDISDRIQSLVDTKEENSKHRDTPGGVDLASEYEKRLVDQGLNPYFA